MTVLLEAPQVTTAPAGTTAPAHCNGTTQEGRPCLYPAIYRREGTSRVFCGECRMQEADNAYINTGEEPRFIRL